MPGSARAPAAPARARAPPPGAPGWVGGVGWGGSARSRGAARAPLRGARGGGGGAAPPPLPRLRHPRPEPVRSPAASWRAVPGSRLRWGRRAAARRAVTGFRARGCVCGRVWGRAAGGGSLARQGGRPPPPGGSGLVLPDLWGSSLILSALPTSGRCPLCPGSPA